MSDARSGDEPMTKGQSWGPNDLVGGPVDEILRGLHVLFQDLRVERLSVTHTGDDNNVWFITRPSRAVEVQLDSMPSGMPPFLLESDSGRSRTDEVSTAVTTLASWLRE